MCVRHMRAGARLDQRGGRAKENTAVGKNGSQFHRFDEAHLYFRLRLFFVVPSRRTTPVASTRP